MSRVLIALLLGWSSLVTAGPMAYVANEKSGTLSVVDTARDEVVAQIKAGTSPRGMALSVDRKRLYVSDQPASALLVVDLAKGAVADKIDLGESPEGVSSSPDGRWVVAAVEISNSVAFVDPARGAVVFSVRTR
ncbi:MAG TPA: hypothetical protein VEV21_05925, partial [Burkholderiales bacterium]|nr:hypothetical protein [Burkholderiales bacterium]